MKTVAKVALTRESVTIVRTTRRMEDVLKPGFFNDFASELEVGDFLLVFSHTGGDTDTMEAAICVVVVNDKRGVQTRDLRVPTP